MYYKEFTTVTLILLGIHLFKEITTVRLYFTYLYYLVTRLNTLYIRTTVVISL